MLRFKYDPNFREKYKEAITEERVASFFIKIYLMPNSKQTKIVGVLNKELQIRLSSLPVDGRANKDLIYLLSKTIKVPKTSFSIVQGERSKHKKIKVTLF